MTKEAYSRLDQAEKEIYDKYMAEYYAGKHFANLVERYTPQVNKMDKAQLAYAICNGGNLFGMDYFAWRRLKEIGPELPQLQHIKMFGRVYSPEIYEEAMTMYQELIAANKND